MSDGNFADATIARDIAEFVLSASWNSMPAAVRREAGRSLLNWVGCALGGARTETMDCAVRALAALGGDGSCPVIGRPESFDPANATLLNCLGSSAQAFDDTHLKTITHPTGPVAAAALAVIYQRRHKRPSGQDLLLAVALGVEVECRMSKAVLADGKGADLGWYLTGVSGGVGAAVAAGQLLHLDLAQMVSAIGLAAAQACGIRSIHGSMATAFVPAVAGRNGLMSAFLAEQGFTCSPGAIDGRNGLMQVMGKNTDVAQLRDGLGTHFELLLNAYKPYPCGIVIHPVIDACLELARHRVPDHRRIQRLDLRVHAGALNLCWKRLPVSALDAQVSLFHWAAAALVTHQAGVAQSELPCVMNGEVRSLQERIHATVDPHLASDQAVVRCNLTGGEVEEVRIEHAVGSAANPMTDTQLADKFGALARPILGEQRGAQLLALCRDMASSNDPLWIFDLTRPSIHGCP